MSMLVTDVTTVTIVTIVTMFTCCSGYVNAPEVFCTAEIC